MGDEPYPVINDDVGLLSYAGSKHKILVERVLQYSSSSDWATALDEWTFVSEWDAGDEQFPCLCTQGKNPNEEIRYLSYIRNLNSGAIARIGSHCIDKFMAGSQLGADLQTFKATRSAKYISEKARVAALEAGVLSASEVTALNLLGRRSKVEQQEYFLLCTAKAKISMTKALVSPMELVNTFCDFDGEYPFESFQRADIEAVYKQYRNLCKQVANKSLTYDSLRNFLFVLTMFHWAQAHERFTLLPDANRSLIGSLSTEAISAATPIGIEEAACAKQQAIATTLTNEHDKRFETTAYKRIAKQYPPIYFIIKELQQSRWDFDRFAGDCFELSPPTKTVTPLLE